MTPEGRVKAAVKKVLKKYPHYGLWPVPSGYGESTLDYIGCICGLFFAIETKRPGGEPTPRQKQTIKAMQDAEAEVFVIDGNPQALRELEAFLLAATYHGKVTQ